MRLVQFSSPSDNGDGGARRFVAAATTAVRAGTMISTMTLPSSSAAAASLSAAAAAAAGTGYRPHRLPPRTQRRPLVVRAASAPVLRGRRLIGAPPSWAPPSWGAAIVGAALLLAFPNNPRRALGMAVAAGDGRAAFVAREVSASPSSAASSSRRPASSSSGRRRRPRPSSWRPTSPSSRGVSRP